SSLSRSTPLIAPVIVFVSLIVVLLFCSMPPTSIAETARGRPTPRLGPSHWSIELWDVRSTSPGIAKSRQSRDLATWTSRPRELDRSARPLDAESLHAGRQRRRGEANQPGSSRWTGNLPSGLLESREYVRALELAELAGSPRG